MVLFEIKYDANKIMQYCVKNVILIFIIFWL